MILSLEFLKQKIWKATFLYRWDRIAAYTKHIIIFIWILDMYMYTEGRNSYIFSFLYFQIQILDQKIHAIVRKKMELEKSGE